MNISVIGLGKLGAPLAALMAGRCGYPTIGVDTSEHNVKSINAGQSPVQEPGLPELLNDCAGKLHATQNYGEAIANSEVTFVIVPTPSDETGRFSLKYIHEAIAKIGQELQKKDSFHLVVITSTVMPGATETEIVPALESASGKRCGEGFGVCYSPEFIALGSIIHDMLYPDFILVGESDSKSGDILESIYRQLCPNNPPIARMSPVNAELAKISVNTFVTTKISYANMLAEVCERLPGANVNTVTQAIGLDSRIGQKYLKGATGYGGPCFPRDNIAFGVMARSLGVEPLIAEATDVVNKRQSKRLLATLSPYLASNLTVGILGVAYKPDTGVIEESQGIALARELTALNTKVILYDSLALDNARQLLGKQVEYASFLEDCLNQSQIIVIMTPCQEFREIQLTKLIQGTIILDCWHLFDRQKVPSTMTYIAIGEGAISNF